MKAADRFRIRIAEYTRDLKCGELDVKDFIEMCRSAMDLKQVERDGMDLEELRGFDEAVKESAARLKIT